MIIQYRSVSGFQSLLFRGPGELEIRQAEDDSLCIEAIGSHLDQIESEVVDDQLNLGIRQSDVIDFSLFKATIKYQLCVKDLKSLRVLGRGTVTVSDLDRDDFSVSLSGCANVKLNHLTADQLTVKLADSASLEVSGDIEYQSGVLSHHAVFNAEKLVSDSADFRLVGAAKAKVRANDALSVYVSEQSQLTYFGYPELNKQGAGTLIRRRKNQFTAKGSEHG